MTDQQEGKKPKRTNAAKPKTVGKKIDVAAPQKKAKTTSVRPQEKGVEKKPLTQKQENFAREFFETGNAAEAYRRAYDVAKDAKDGWIYVEACQLLDNPNVAIRVEELRQQAERHSIYTRQKAMEELEEARLSGMANAMPAAAVSAINSKIKLYGLEAPTKIALGGDGDSPPVKLKIETDIPAEAAAAYNRMMMKGK